MLTKNDVVPFVIYAKQVCGLLDDQIRDVIYGAESELNRYNISIYRPIVAFQKTVFQNSELVSLPVCRWFFFALVNYYLKNGIAIPDDVAKYIRPTLTPVIVSKLRRFQKYGFVVTDQRIDEASCFVLEIMFGSVDGRRFLVVENYSYDEESGIIILNGKVKATCSPASISAVEHAKLSGLWVCVSQKSGEKYPRLMQYATQNIVRASVSVACRQFVENAIGRNLQGDDTSYEISDQYGKLESLVFNPQKRREFPLHEFLHDENTSVFYRAVIYAESLHCPFAEKPIVASEFCGKTLNIDAYYRLLKKARKVAERYYKSIIATE